MAMDDIVPVTIHDEKKRKSGDAERPVQTDLASLDADKQSAVASSSVHPSKRQAGHHRSSSAHHQAPSPALPKKSPPPPSPYMNTAHSPGSSSLDGSTAGRRGSLPPLLKIYTGNYPNAQTSPVQQKQRSSPFTTHLPTLPEKGSISIQINQPGKTDLTRHLIQPQHHHLLKNVLYILSWYFFSTSLSLYNKNLMGKDHFNFQLPLLVSAIHAGLHSIITFFMITFDGDRWRGEPKSQQGPPHHPSTYDYFHKVVSQSSK
ncbi:hypothetical protein DM01DRAFT_1122166 [Hesseltinella vesiculosa]|uniref:Uncharacterized protein n=1 Tax=Hesseltinella vesiculosa TaxID=101127 RepID=A0A1X2GTS9_9FUNG|nr:hypothetical protein DM01DRAFT_1122166 [Hesseltinella vesiculosa]